MATWRTAPMITSRTIETATCDVCQTTLEYEQKHDEAPQGWAFLRRVNRWSDLPYGETELLCAECASCVSNVLIRRASLQRVPSGP